MAPVHDQTRCRPLHLSVPGGLQFHLPVCDPISCKPIAPVMRKDANPFHLRRSGHVVNPFHLFTVKHIADTMCCLGLCVANFSLGCSACLTAGRRERVSKLVPVHGPHVGSALQHPIHNFNSSKNILAPSAIPTLRYLLGSAQLIPSSPKVLGRTEQV